jgi:hypothetical protein
MNTFYKGKIEGTKEIAERSKNMALVGLTDELKEKLISDTAIGNSLLSFASKNGLKEEVVRGWLYYDRDLNEAYRLAQEESHLARFEEIENLSETALGEVKALEEDEKKYKYAQVLLNAYDLRITTLKWKLSKINPRRYSEKMDITSGGKAIGGNTIVFAEFGKDKEIVNVIDLNKE